VPGFGNRGPSAHDRICVCCPLRGSGCARSVPASSEMVHSDRITSLESTAHIQQVRARPEPDRNCGCEESPDSPACLPNTACGQPEACTRGRFRRYTEVPWRSGLPAFKRRMSLVGTMWSMPKPTRIPFSAGSAARAPNPEILSDPPEIFSNGCGPKH
jgi:hypothetical protein